MGRHLIRTLFRLSQFVASLFFLVVLCFGLLKFFPGSPFVEETNLNPAVVSELQKFYGLDQTLPVQIQTYLSKVVRGDFGTSMYFPGRSVKSLIWEFGQVSLLLGILAFILALLVAVAFAYWSRRESFRFKAKADLFLIAGISLPTLALGPLLIWVICVKLDLLPVALLQTPASYILPVIVLAIRPALSLARILSLNLDDTLKEKYIQVAKSFGFSDRKILLKWAFKNSLVGTISKAGFIAANLISGSFLVEILFAIPGLGFYFVESVLSRDWPLILGITLFYGLLLLTVQFISDLLLEAINPRGKSQ